MANWFQNIRRWFNKPVAKDLPPKIDAPKPVAPPTPAVTKPAAVETLYQAIPEAADSEKLSPEQLEPAPPVIRPVSSASPAPARPIQAQQPVVDLMIGFDLGTSCSKVCIGDSMDGKQYGVSFQTSAHGVGKYLFPSRFYEGTGGVSLTSTTEATLVSNLKLRLIDAVANETDITVAETDLAIYVALILKHTLAWYEQERANDHRSRPRCWWLSMGFPAKRVDNNPKLHQAYQRFVGAAIQAVNSGEAISRPVIQRCLTASLSIRNGTGILAMERVNYYPEIAAQLAGYAYSRYRTAGPMVLIDVGAGTLDISTLILHQRDHEDFCSFQFCEVAPLGAFRLYQHLHQALAAVSPHTVEPLVSIGADQNWRAPESASEYLRPPSVVTALLKKAFLSTRENFSQSCLERALENFACFKRYLDEPFKIEGQRPPAFRQKVNIILSGGGSRAHFYRELFPKSLEARVLKNGLTLWHLDPAHRIMDGQGFHSRHLMKPDKFFVNGVPDEDFDRLSVAHGLSLSAETILQITAKEMSDR
jgi:hypothetical protein